MAESLARAARLNFLRLDRRWLPARTIARRFGLVRFPAMRGEAATLTNWSNSLRRASILSRNATAFLSSRRVRLVNGFVVIAQAVILSLYSSQVAEGPRGRWTYDNWI